ncbi:X-linked lymphocyte-regulated protein PM1 isoform X2 [Mus musculus]|uniref:X-linked lymphocyte-regulated protein PM1 isoform X2 n=1 Tax=Mus musculus TaxID=10090 RepID=UPI0002507A6C|nr:X-linked lymphocyte-regulated protein PM1 isoform X2 [Mus musculus]|eukprot:XP_011249410.1 PREDICTED: X-linked lymphocyte-regulated protein PM1-like isoform X2 [Mus musculus]
MLDKSGDDIYKTLHIKRKWMETYVKESFKGRNQKLERFCKMNERERKNINNKFCEQYITTFQKSYMDVQKFNEEKEKSVNSCQKEQQALKLSKCSQNQTLEAAASLDSN